ncbi:histidine phosphatase family protein [Mesorhizobium sp. LjNodule214]|uniref:histidine phosphatase family protein n=1 Tax=Mesorhizobium sp. LjNodule214 TaxID=3342252 RepID=UPI003ED0D6A5
MKLILGRHGNTFERNEEVLWVGRRTDLPLTAEGSRQAEHLGAVLCQSGILLSGLYCGPLQRTRQHAAMVAQRIGCAPGLIVDSRLAEIDYGAWEGMSSQEIVAQFGREELEAWERSSTWPRSPGWSPSEAALTDGVKTFVRQLSQTQGEDSVVLAVTSNGVLSCFSRLAKGHMGRRGGKVATGHICILDARRDNWLVHAWNVAPDPACLLS